MSDMIVVAVIAYSIGIIIGLLIGSIAYVSAYKYVRAMADKDRENYKTRIDELSAWSKQQYDASRKELGLPPRAVQ